MSDRPAPATAGVIDEAGELLRVLGAPVRLAIVVELASVRRRACRCCRCSRCRHSCCRCRHSGRTRNGRGCIAFAVLAAGLPTLVSGLRLPRWAGVVAGAGCALVAATAWGTGTLAVHAAGLLTDAQMAQESAWFTLFQAGQSLPCAVGFVALAVAGLRRRAVSRGVGALLLVAGVVSLLPAYPPGALLASLALVWIAGSARGDAGAASS